MNAYSVKKDWFEPPRYKPRLAVFKFASCDGCQLQLLSCEDELLELADKVEVVHFLEATSHIEPGPYDIALVEGSITTHHDQHRIYEVRAQSKVLIAIGACATAGGIQALRNWGDHTEFLRAVYAKPDVIDSLSTSTAIADHVDVDFELRGCPINRYQLLEVVISFLAGRRPRIPQHSVCMECKRQLMVCTAVAHGTPCLGPITHAGCGAICPRFGRGCYGCFGPAGQANCDSLADNYLATRSNTQTLVPLLRNFNAAADEFRETGDRVDEQSDSGVAK
ncbi:MAG: oxidoreductase [Planctomycetales bacterium]|nr:oxidoreductase [Planctomycetales bacterium]